MVTILNMDRDVMVLKNDCMNCHAGSCKEHHRSDDINNKGINAPDAPSKFTNILTRLPVELQLETVIRMHPLTIISLKSIPGFDELWAHHGHWIESQLFKHHFNEEQAMFPRRPMMNSAYPYQRPLFSEDTSTATYFLFLEKISTVTNAIARYLAQAFDLQQAVLPQVRNAVLHLWRWFGTMEACPPANRDQDIWDYLSSLPTATRDQICEVLSWLGDAYLLRYGMHWQDGLPERLVDELCAQRVDWVCATYLCMEYLRAGMAEVLKETFDARPLVLEDVFGDPANWWCSKGWGLPYSHTRPVTLTAYDTYEIRVLGSRCEGTIEMVCPNELGGDYLRALTDSRKLPVGRSLDWRRERLVSFLDGATWVNPRTAYWHWAEWADECLGVRRLLGEA